MKKFIIAIVLMANILYLSGCAQSINNRSESDTREITVCAAASLKEVLDEIKPKFEQSKNIKVTYSFAGSGTLQKQIEEGAPVDLFISAGKNQMDALENENLIDKESRKNVLENRIVLVVSKEYKNKIKTAADLNSFDINISIGEPKVVPAGQYAKESLQNMNLWDKLSSKMVLAKDVRQVLTYVEKGEAAAGIVYASDAAVIKESVVAEVFDENTHSSIVYPAAIVSASKDKSSAKIFMDYLMSDESQQVFKKYGFSGIPK